MSRTDKEVKFCDVTVTVSVNEERIKTLLVSALEGGSNYWYTIKGYEFLEGIKYGDFREDGRFATEEYYHPTQLIPFQEGCALLFGVEDDDGIFRLDRTAMEKGIQLMAEKFPVMFHEEVLEKNCDANTGDTFLQLALFGEIVYC